MLKEALEYSCDYVDTHPEFVPPGMTRDCAVAVVLYTFGAYGHILIASLFIIRRQLHRQAKEHLQESEQLFILASF